MFFIRYLTWATAYVIILLEIYSGAVNGPLWWALPGGLVLCLLFALAHYAGTYSNYEKEVISPVEVRFKKSEFWIWAAILLAGFLISIVTNFIGRTFIREAVLVGLAG